MGRRVLLSHFTCSGYRTHCHLLVPLNYSVALFFYLKCSPFLISIILYPQESLNIVSFHLWGSQTSFSLTEMHLLKAVSEHLDWESVGARAKGKGQRMSCSLKKVLEYHKAASWLWDAYWPLEYLCQKLEDTSLASVQCWDALCSDLWYSNCRLENVASHPHSATQ